MSDVDPLSKYLERIAAALEQIAENTRPEEDEDDRRQVEGFRGTK